MEVVNMKCILVALVIVIGTSFNCFSYDGKTHKVISEHLVKGDIEEFNFNTYLIDCLDLRFGYREIIKSSVITDQYQFQISKPIEKVVASGSDLEDSPPWRCVHHFHNPLTSWDTAGLGLIEIGRYRIIDGYSSIVWAQRPTGDQNDGCYSWHDTRRYYYQALVSTDPGDRESCFWQTFEGLGRLMHLVQDATVPEHVRLDSHMNPFEYHYEVFMLDERNKPYIDLWLKMNDRYTYNDSISQLPPEDSGLAPIPIARMVDTDRYDGVNPEDTVNQPTGISEYTNANFFSKDTIFKDFVHPARENFSAPEYLGRPDPRDPSQTVDREYIEKNGGGETGTLLCLSLVSDDASPEEPICTLDDEVYRGYASRLIPRAVSYSAGLLKYFFRGTMELTLPDEGFYAFMDSLPTDPTTQGFTRLAVMAKNTTSQDEEMSDGDMHLVVKYRPSLTDPFGQAVPDWDNLQDFKYVEIPYAGTDRDIPRDAPRRYEFDLTSNPIPLWATDVTIFLVYKGKLGKDTAEGYVGENEAICVGFKDIAEPTPVDIMNMTDFLCLNGQWYDVHTTQGLADAQAIIGDRFWYSIEPRAVHDMYFRFSSDGMDASPEHYSYMIDTLEQQQHRRVFLLTDYSFHLSCYCEEFAEPVSTGEYAGLGNYIGYEYNENTQSWAGTWYYPGFRPFRGLDLFDSFIIRHLGVCTDENGDPTTAGCPTCEDDLIGAVPFDSTRDR